MPAPMMADQNPGVINTSDRPIFPGVPPAEMMIELMSSQNPDQDVGGLLSQLATLTHRGRGEDGENIPQTSPMADRAYRPAPDSFETWLLTADPNQINELGDSLQQAYKANPEQIDQLWDIVQGLLERKPEVLPDSLISVITGVKDVVA